MNLKNIASKPKLIELKLEDEDILKEYGEAITFYTWDRPSMDVFTKLSLMSEKQDLVELLKLVQELVLDEQGNKILEEDTTLPTPVMMKVIQTVSERLGK